MQARRGAAAPPATRCRRRSSPPTTSSPPACSTGSRTPGVRVPARRLDRRLRQHVPRRAAPHVADVDRPAAPARWAGSRSSCCSSALDGRTAPAVRADRAGARRAQVLRPRARDDRAARCARRALAAVCAPVLAASAIAHATGGRSARRPGRRRGRRRPGAVATGFTAGGGRVVTVAHASTAVGRRCAAPTASRGAATVLRRDARTRPRAARRARAATPRPRRLRPAPTARPARGRASRALPARVTRRITAHVRQAGDVRVALRPALELRRAVRRGRLRRAASSRDGRVAGVVFARSRDRAGVAYAVDARALDGFVAP